MKKTLTILCAISLLAFGEKASAQSYIDMKFVGRYQSGIFDEGATEINAFDPATARLFSVNGFTGNVDILDLSVPSAPAFIESIDLSMYGSGANSIDFRNGVLAAAVEADVKQDSGKVVFFDAFGNILGAVTVGALPDMVNFSKGGDKVLVACEGEPSADYSVDPNGVVGIINVSGTGSSFAVNNVTLIDFSAYNSNPVPGVRVFGPGANFAMDMEPEYITISPNGKVAWVTLQENNAVAKINLLTNTLEWVRPLGYKDHSIPGNGMDASDRNSGTVNITTWPVKGMFMPDAIDSYDFNGSTYLVTANEGDVREYDTYEENARVKDLDLDTVAFPNYAALASDNNLGRLNVTTAQGDVDGDGDFDELYSFGGRSFSIFDENGVLIFDSGDFIEIYTAGLYSSNFNASNTNNTKKNRSDDKGPEPEGVTVVTLIDSVYAFVGLERVGGIMVFNITNPYSPVFVDYINTRDFSVSPNTQMDLGAEGLLFIPSNLSPNGKNLLVVAYEISGTVAVYETDVLCGNKKVLICLNGATRCVNQTQLSGYLAAGAVVGPCQGSARVSENTIPAGVIAFPNPASESVSLRLSGLAAGGYEVMLVDMKGSVVHKENKIIDQEGSVVLCTISAEKLMSGLYTYRVSGANEVQFSGRVSVVK